MDDLAVAKILPPTRPPGWISRPGLTALVAEVLARRLTIVSAEAGFGKSSLAASWWDETPCAWYTLDRGDRDLASFGRHLGDALRLRVPDLPVELEWLGEAGVGPKPDEPARADALASRLAGVLHERLGAHLVLVIDDAHELVDDSPSARLVEALCRHAPPRLHLVLSGRRRPPFPIERLRGRGQLLEVTGEQLAFTAAETRELLAAQIGAETSDIAGELHRVTGGWPAAVVLAVEAFRASPRTTWATMQAELERPDAPVVSYLAEEVFAHHPPEVRTLISRLALLDTFTADLAAAVAGPEAGSRIEELLRQGPYLERRQDGSLSLRPLIRDFARERLRLNADEARATRVAAVEWLLLSADPAPALELLADAGAAERLSEVLLEHGPAMLAAGHVGGVIDACRAVPVDRRAGRIHELEGEALQLQGDWAGALACFQRAASALAAMPSRLAWRMGVIHYLRGELDLALEIERRGLEDQEAAPAERALLLAWTATVHWVRGEEEPCRRLATGALEAAQSCGDLRALAAAHTVMAMLAALDGDRRANDAHYLLALRAAEEAPDILQTVRIRTNRASHFMEEGSYPEALQELEVAVRLAELTSFASFLALSLCNRGETLLRMGRLEQALADLEASRSKYQHIGSDMIAYPLALIGEVYRERGNLALARASFEEAIAVSEKSGDVQGLVPALAGLATVLAAEESDRARQLADRALACGTGLHYVQALLASGWVAAACGDPARATADAMQAASFARARRDRAGLADALGLAAMVTDDVARRSDGLAEALAISREIGNDLGAAKIGLAMALLRAGEPHADAVRRLEELGVRAGTGARAAGLLALASAASAPPLTIQSLGGFTVLRGGRPVPLGEWQSRRARELLKLLIARRGRRTTRAFLMEALWPGEDADRVANRLSVALSTVRTVLDPARQHPPDHFVVADKDSVLVNVQVVDIDLERFLRMMADGLAAVRRGETARGIPALDRAAALYAGDFLEENLYDDWAAAAREEARAAYVAGCRVLALDASARWDADAAVPHFLRVLEVDRYDEQANLGLVSTLSQAGRHGEAHRHYVNYCRAMEELGVEPAPFPPGRRGANHAMAPTFSAP